MLIAVWHQWVNREFAKDRKEPQRPFGMHLLEIRRDATLEIDAPIWCFGMFIRMIDAMRNDYSQIPSKVNEPDATGCASQLREQG